MDDYILDELEELVGTRIEGVWSEGDEIWITLDNGKTIWIDGCVDKISVENFN